MTNKEWIVGKPANIVAIAFGEFIYYAATEAREWNDDYDGNKKWFNHENHKYQNTDELYDFWLTQKI